MVNGPQKRACDLSKKRIQKLEAQRKKSGAFMKAINKGRIAIQKRFLNRACGKKL